MIVPPIAPDAIEPDFIRKVIPVRELFALVVRFARVPAGGEVVAVLVAGVAGPGDGVELAEVVVVVGEVEVVAPAEVGHGELAEGGGVGVFAVAFGYVEDVASVGVGGDVFGCGCCGLENGKVLFWRA